MYASPRCSVQGDHVERASRSRSTSQDPDLESRFRRGATNRVGRSSTQQYATSSAGGQQNAVNVSGALGDLFNWKPRSSIGSKRQKFSAKQAKKKRRVPTWTHAFICCSATDQEQVPDATERAKRQLAGLGEKRITFPQDADGVHFAGTLVVSFPKLESGGGFELLRTPEIGGKDLQVIPVPEAGYSVEYVRAVVHSAKVFIRPIQDLDLSSVKDEFVLAPEELCRKCERLIPVDQLRDHISGCRSTREPPSSPTYTPSPRSTSPQTPSPRSEPSLNTPSPHSLSPPPYSPLTPINSEKAIKSVEPGIIDLTKMEEVMIAKAISESLEGGQSVVHHPKTLTVLRQAANFTMPKSKEEWFIVPQTCIDVRRSHILQDTLREMRKPRFDCTQLLKVSFVGEEAVDTGGPGREFLRLLMYAIESNYCCGDEGKKVFARNTNALRSSELKMLGTLAAMSILQGGPGIPVFSPVVYGYISTKQYDPRNLTDQDVPDHHVRRLLAL